MVRSGRARAPGDRSVLGRLASPLLLSLALLLAFGAVMIVQARRLTAEPAAAVSGAPAGAVLRWSNEGISDIYTLDPAGGPDFNALQAIQLIYGGLVRFGPGFRILPDAAQRWTISGDNRTFTFFLRPDVRFGDGKILTADDVAFSLNRVLSPGLAQQSGAYLLTDVVGAPGVMAGRAKRAAGIEVLGPRTIRIRLTHTSASFLARLATPVGYIVPPWRVRAGAGWDQRAIGTGPFMVARWVHNDSLQLVPNPYYYGGKLELSGIDMSFIPEPLNAYKRYRAGAVDLMGIVHFPSEVLYDVQGQPDFHQSARLETVYLTLNERRRPFNDMRVRLAFAHALDKNAVVRDAYGGFAHPTNGMLPPGIPGYDPRLRGASYDPVLARRLLAAAGYAGGRGLPPVSYPVDQDASSMVLASALARQWKQVLGVDVRLVRYTHSAYLDLLQRLQFQIADIDWTADYPDPDNFLTQQLQAGSPNNNGGWDNRLFDQLTTRAGEMPPASPQRFALYRRAEALAMSQAATIPLVNPTAGILLRPDIHGLQISGGYLLVQNWATVGIQSGTGQ